MARIAAARTPASPASRSQAARRARILDAAAEFGATAEFDRVQMADIAKAAGVALGTLYRYFPAKTHLFAAVFEDRIARFADQRWTRTDDGPVADIGANLVALNRALLEQPRLCEAMLRAAAAGFMKDLPAETLWLDSGSALTTAILETLGVHEPGTHDRSVVGLLVYSWWGVLASSLSHRISSRRAENDLRLAASLILAGYAE
ncbi:TetR/AcrR family transcriptional regulator [Nocardia sp. BMG51109]|uniref:TetR/AcrR family transcriptional regulator n=1 Tax=Nocardia sp. BMG51109 TaxID=1056816 RepID=UPI000467E7E8|nr:TetR/AcrR family transcriptional regulator [Nocardia sp. BMG51109]